MSVAEFAMLMTIGLAMVAGVPAVLYFLLPQSVLRSATRHGRYAGLGIQDVVSHVPPGNGAAYVGSWAAHAA